MLPPVPEFLRILDDKDRRAPRGVFTVAIFVRFSDLSSYSDSYSKLGARMSCKAAGPN